MTDIRPITRNLLIVMALTGLFLSFSYLPHPLSAYESVARIQNSVFLGRLIRGVHRNLAVAVVLWFLINFYVTLYQNARGGVGFVRALFRGLFLLLGILAWMVTGSLLPWDQPSYAGVISSLTLFGSKDALGEGALFRAYWLHILAFPALVFWLVFKPDTGAGE